jgi:hypothetical protein
MSRLITFGCSFTYGSGLPDCIESPAGWQSPSKYSWTKILADKLGHTLVNKSFPGASNLEILYKILDFNFFETDQVVIMWTMPLREMIFNNSRDSFQRLGSWMKDNTARSWMRIATEYDYTHRSWLYVHHAELYLNNKNIKHLHFPAFSWTVECPKYLTINNLCLDEIVHCDSAADQAHPGVESNKQTADRIFKYINENK